MLTLALRRALGEGEVSPRVLGGEYEREFAQRRVTSQCGPKLR